MHDLYMNDSNLGLRCGRKEGKNGKAQSKEK
jgi:hypothetical protein